MLVMCMFAVEIFLTTLPSTSLPRYFMTCCLGLPSTLLDSTNAK